MRIFLLYVACIVAAEFITVLVDPVWGIVVYFFILVATIVVPAVQDHYQPSRIILSLSLVPAIRIISLSMPLTDIPQIWWYPIIYTPLLAAAIMLIRVLGFSRKDLGLVWGNWPLQLLIALSGLGLGLIEWLIIEPEPLIDELTLGSVLLPALLLIVTTGFVEELIFRGVLQKVATESFQNAGIVLVSAIFAILHIGFLSVIDVVFVFVVALAFAWIVKKSGSLFGVTLAHGLTNSMLFLLAPFILSG